MRADQSLDQLRHSQGLRQAQALFSMARIRPQSGPATAATGLPYLPAMGRKYPSMQRGLRTAI